MVTLEGIVLWNNQPDREAFGLVRKGVGQSTVLRAVETPYPKVNPIQSNPTWSLQIYILCTTVSGHASWYDKSFIGGFHQAWNTEVNILHISCIDKIEW